jgi:hypothetical protein
MIMTVIKIIIQISIMILLIDDSSNGGSCHNNDNISNDNNNDKNSNCYNNNIDNSSFDVTLILRYWINWGFSFIIGFISHFMRLS